ncbi:hypothetical protein GQ457_01G032340 [Hibiscus cannabinus]
MAATYLVLVLVGMLCTVAMAQSGCTSVLIGLSPCLNYVTGTSSTPSQQCCTQLASVVRCGGVLRTSEGNMRAIFSGPVACEGLDFAELLTVKNALLLFIEANWVGKVFLILESDSQLTLHWIMNSDSRPWRWWKDFEEIDSLVKTIGQVKFDFVPRERNCLADKLAKAGLGRSTMFKAWW